MPKKLEDLFQEEVRSRKLKETRRDGGKVGKFVLVVSIVIGLAYLIHQCNSIPVADEPVKQATQPVDKPEPVALPPSGIKKHVSPSSDSLGRLRIFLRAPLSSDKSSLPVTCGNDRVAGNIRNKDHYFVELLDWQSDEVITTAFIRSGDMLEIPVPFGTYKLRYAAGTEWYGDQEMFGSEDMYEMTEQFSSEAAKFEFTQKKPGHDIATYCSNGNLGTKRVNKNPRQNSLPIKEKGTIE